MYSIAITGCDYPMPVKDVNTQIPPKHPMATQQSNLERPAKQLGNPNSSIFQLGTGGPGVHIQKENATSLCLLTMNYKFICVAMYA